MKTSKAALIILDGWGIGPDPERSALSQADTPFMDGLMDNRPLSSLVTYGEEVGLPAGQMGNSEVGHLNIGAGRVVYQELARINKAVKEKTLEENEILKAAFNHAKKNKQKVHLMGLLSDGGVHSHIEHLLALTDICEKFGLDDVYIHVFLDGRDTSPNGGADYLKKLQDHIKSNHSKLATVVGRYYAMDRDKRWERIKIAYDLMVNGIGKTSTDLIATVEDQYRDGITDEFMNPILVDSSSTIGNDDLVLCFNFRTDRPRQITEVLTQKDFPDFNMHPLSIDYLTMTEYDQTFKNIKALFTKDNLVNTLGEVIAYAGKTQLRIAETEKYPHVTYFFSGGKEAPFPGEDRIVIPSPKVATYDLAPAMSAREVTAAAIQKITEAAPDFLCLNFANTDMLGHTGVFSAAMEAATVVDSCMSELMSVLKSHGYQTIIIADHGNSDYMINDDGSPHTAHTTNPVPCILISQNDYTLKDGKLGDIAPSICMLMGLEVPEEMTGTSLISINS